MTPKWLTDLHTKPFGNTIAEVSLLGCVFLDPTCLKDVGKVEPDDFTIPQCQALWQYMRDEYAECRRVDPVRVWQRAIEDGQDWITAEWIGGAAKSVPHARWAGEYAETVRMMAKRRRLVDEALRMAEAAYEFRLDDAEEFRRQIMKVLNDPR